MAFTFFFRDEQTLKVLLEHALPVMQGQAFIRIWDAGCAHGPEPYTLAILLRERMSAMYFRNVRIHATDLESQFRSQVVSGIFPQEELQRVPAELFQKYFQPADGAPGASGAGQFQVVEEVRSRIEFTRHDLLSLTPVRPDLSLIVCKNVLLHFNERQRCDVLRMFHGALRKDGLLVMEHTQKVPEALRPCWSRWRRTPKCIARSKSRRRAPCTHGRCVVWIPARQIASACRLTGPCRTAVPPPSTCGRLTPPPANPPRDVFVGPTTSTWCPPAMPPNFLPHLNQGE